MKKLLPRQVLLRLAFPLALLLAQMPVQAQRPAHFEPPAAPLAHAMELFDKAQYGAALHEFDRIAQQVRDLHGDLRVEAEFWGAISAVRLFHGDASHRLLAFIDAHPENFHVPAVRLELFRFYFDGKRWQDALYWAVLVDETALGTADRTEFTFKKGYALFMHGDPDKALLEFAEVKDGTGLYAAPATYYTAHINYTKRNYAAALEGFEKLKDDAAFGRVVPYYIAQIKFLQGHYEALLEYAQPLLADPGNTKNKSDINRLAGEAYFRTGQYKEALPYIEKSLQRPGVERGDRYIAGYAWYKNDQYQQAITQFTQVVNNSTDSLAQLAAYHMADCYLKLNQKNYARNAFKKAYDLGNDPNVAEDALFNYAKLAYELSFDPYNEAIIALRDYMAKYPGSARHDEAQEFLLDVYLKTKNYEAALAALDAIKTKDLRLKEAYQKLAFDRGVELYEGRQYAEARKFFQKALVFPVDPKATVQAHYWAGEASYALGDYDAALAKYDDVRNAGGAYASALYEQASYGMGYAYFKQKQYGEAATAFRRTVEHADLPKAQRNDALVRTGDCFYVTKDFAAAITWYDKAISAGAAARDYAQYQKGVCQGLEKKNDQKIATLKQLLRDKPNSQYAADAKFQLGETYLNMGKDAEALDFYKQVTGQHPNSPHVRQSMLQSALIDKRQGRTAQALDGFKAVVAKYPTMDGSREALTGIESIYSQQGDMAAYEAYVRSLTFVDAASLDLDEKYFRSAEQLYFAEQCDQAVGAFRDYISKYPKGAFVTNAEFYAADCLYRAKKAEEALPGFERVAAAGEGQFLEPSLAAASQILFQAGRQEAALPYFTRLAQVAALPVNVLAGQAGRMRCLVQMNSTAEAAEAAKQVLANGDANADLKAEAGLAVGRGEIGNGELDAAYNRFKAIANGSKNAYGAEAAYQMAYVRYLQKRYKDGEKEVLDLAKKFPSYDHWKAKAFILLGDIYVGLEDLFQARATLQSVVDNCDEPDLVEQAAQRLANITEAAEPKAPGADLNPTPDEE
ncbi:MAG: tetratricopeptide repeat protein [Flavobacteriales bacterium]|nr:tetratricopeptide repeat protein [Flavobacteriales bacterium]MBP9079793.1 tetratricopeptide repeat protein [Flavobacteriales bacterium]